MKLANTVTQLCTACGFSRRWFYELRKQNGAPVPRANGKFPIEAWIRFSRKQKAVVKPDARGELELLCLRQKSELQQLELSERRGEIESEIHARYKNSLDRALAIFRSELLRMPDLLSPRFEALSAREIHALWKSQLNDAFGRIHNALTGRESPGRERKIVPFEKKVASAA